MREEGRWVTGRRGEKWKQKERRLLKGREGRTGGRTASSQPLSSAPHARPRPLHVPRVLESVSSRGGVGGEVAMASPPSGPGRGLFSQLLIPSAQCKGEQLSQASGMCSGSREA